MPYSIPVIEAATRLLVAAIESGKIDLNARDPAALVELPQDTAEQIAKAYKIIARAIHE